MENLFFGVDYYPEHWPRERWETDAALMEEMGLSVVRLAEFSWAKMEPNLGEFHFEWLQEAIEILGKHGIKTVLGTPTAAPPAWIMEETPEIYPVDSNGIRRGFGGRHHDCQSNKTYRSHIKRFVTAMATTFKDNPYVIGWQIDNELGNSHHDLCMCDSCKSAFQDWLKEKYGSIGVLNKEWGTYFWSQDYASFEQIPAPRRTVTGSNPSAMLDWKRFCSDLIVEFQQYQIDIIRDICKSHFITHNFMGFADKVNYFDLAKNLDFISHDQYPGGFFTTPPHEKNEVLSAALDLMRGTKNQSFWIMEQQSGITGWETMGRTPEPGQLALWAQHTIAHGADTIVFFRFRTCTVGTEQYWHGILPHSGKPGRRFRELKDMIAKLKPIMPELKGTMPKAETGIVYSYDQNYAFQIQPHHPELNYVEQVVKYYKGFYERNIPVDFVSDKEEFHKYKLLVAPLQYLMNPELEKKYDEYVAQGGHLVLTMRTGVKNDNNVCMSEMELPGRLGTIAGIEINDYDCLVGCNTEVLWIKSNKLEPMKAEKWCDIIELKGASVLAEYSSQFYKGSPAITEYSYGKGKVYYVGHEPDHRLMQIFNEYITGNAGINLLPTTPDGVEITLRSAEAIDYVFVMNHNNFSVKVNLPKEWEAVFTGQNSELKPFQVDIYKAKITV
ncbi:beta-galactosidase [Anaerocolumna cellulosilytica]|uniref:Beta-galactosidase n=1 Tax=Anaerocolumna cellulosilytica TaxID=433286 RepID=A0A6S6R4R0_9FIRM|nr:beta-galactosidase [Anaerocolumna cellulosilytica]MBB5197264.1 beta-galactosidase [Anaerocolumna cellulosilytica]BCJ94071.1 beta-galactosidase [Anaerocolumna cellulosilytica]